MKKMIITGGAGFIGTNAADYFRHRGYQVVVIDNLSRKGTDLNLKWLQETGEVVFHQTDITDYVQLRKIFEQHLDVDVVLHLAGQVAVTTSITDPRADFEINLLGTFNVLESLRTLQLKPLVIFSSTNKVYGSLESMPIIETETGYRFKDAPAGVTEEIPLDFHSPYGCSKGGADQYVRDYHRVFDLPTVVFRQSCIYGPHQYGVEDQGWVAWFMIASMLKKELIIYGNGKQVRDILFVTDLVKAYEQAITHREVAAGHIFNIGGGASNTISIWKEFSVILEDMGIKPQTALSDWRAGDQPIFIADTSKAKKILDWQPTTSKEVGIPQLYAWLQEHETEIRQLFT